jgi:hypothetical protein
VAIETGGQSPRFQVFSGVGSGIVSNQFVVFTISTALLFYTTLALAAAKPLEATADSPPPRFIPVTIRSRLRSSISWRD